VCFFAESMLTAGPVLVRFPPDEFSSGLPSLLRDPPIRILALKRPGSHLGRHPRLPLPYTDAPAWALISFFFFGTYTVSVFTTWRLFWSFPSLATIPSYSVVGFLRERDFRGTIPLFLSAPFPQVFFPFLQQWWPLIAFFSANSV